MAAKWINMSKLCCLLLWIFCFIYFGNCQTTDVGLCPCDLTGNACDVNCCCDPDCSELDKEVFSQCLPNSIKLDDKLCFDENVFLFENGPERSGSDGSLFCIYYDNDESRNYYSDPSLVTSETDFISYRDRYGDYSFSNQPLATPVSRIKDYYQSGDPIYVVFPSEAASVFNLPTSTGSSSQCVNRNAAAYLIDTTNTCTRSLELNDCTSLVEIRAESWYSGFRVVKDAFLFQFFNSTSTSDDPSTGSQTLEAGQDVFNNTYTTDVSPLPPRCIQAGQEVNCNFSSLPATPTFDAATNLCSNVVSEVRYRVFTDATFGIDRIEAEFVYTDVTLSTISALSLTQTFSISFAQASQAINRVVRSGNPGYVFGEPLLAGVLNQTTSDGVVAERILMLSNRQERLSLINPSASGDCSSSNTGARVSVLFGEDIKTGCFVSINQNSGDVCRLLQQEIIAALEDYALPNYDGSAYSDNNRYVGTFGNSDIQQTGDWVKIAYINRPPPPSTSGSQCVLSLGMNIQILYANVGALANPQPKVVGVSFVYEEAQLVDYKCSGPFCQPSSTLTQKIEISSSVTFIDVSRLPERVEGQYPTFAVRLPYDFWYPFLSSSASTHSWLCSNLVFLTLSICYILKS